MQIFGLTVSRRTKAVVAPMGLADAFGDPRGWFSILREGFAGAFQRGIRTTTENVLAQATVYACVTLIASDIGKLCPELVTEAENEIWTATQNPAYSPVLRKPNHFQNRIAFFQQWVLSKLIHGNTYVLKARDKRNVITDLYVLDPLRVKALVAATDGSVYYQVNADYLSNVHQEVVIPASEIIHDVMSPLYHPLFGISPISACGLAATQGLNIQHQSSLAFANQLNPGGVLSTPSHIPQDTANRLSEEWQQNFSGPQNVGRVAVLGDGLKFEKMSLTAVDAQLIEQLKWTGETVCSCFHVPPYMVGVGPPPNYNNIEALNQQYYSQCLQILIESIELCLEEGLGLGPEFNNMFGVEFDLEGLLRMDGATKMKAATEGVLGAVFTPNEARAKFNLKPLPGGNTAYLQQQNYSLAALAKRDASADPFLTVRETFRGPATETAPDTGTAKLPAADQIQPVPTPKKSLDDDLDGADGVDLLRVSLDLQQWAKAFAVQHEQAQAQA